MLDTEFHAECSQCAALCCLALEIEKSDKFGLDKQAGVACPNLGTKGRCKIHDSLADLGFSGCVQYDCVGAGQRVTQEVFAGRSWQTEPALRLPMIDAFRVMRQVQELRQLLETVKRVQLDAGQKAERERLEAQLIRHEGWTLQGLLNFEISDVPCSIAKFLSGLKSILAKDGGLAQIDAKTSG